MKVLIGYMIDGRNSGIDKYLLRVLGVLQGAGIQATVLTGGHNAALAGILRPYGAELQEVPSLQHPLGQYAAVKRLVIARHYDAAYFNISEPMNCVGAMAARHAGVPKVILHSHSTCQGETGSLNGKIKAVLNRLARPALYRYGDAFYACSAEAGQWLFPKAVLRSRDYRLLYNPVDVAEFAYQPACRERVRKALGLEDACVIGHIGNYQPAKNSSFLLDIAQSVRQYIPNAVLLSIGDGPERPAVEAAARGLPALRFLGIRDDVPELLQAMDFFVLPSRFEGLPVSAIEAQMAGLKVLLSDRVTREVQLSSYCQFLPIDSGEVWAKALKANWPYPRKDFRQERETVARFDLDKQKDAILAIFEQN
ncbi:MAG TPA: glycosyltransferase [Candidatus Faecousia faecigallinarum]|nr:glycosyltransferase [Candidatus Faecousia faecigallinarum]